MAVDRQPGWYPDPWAQAAHRWWDGAEWTGQVAPVAPAAQGAPAPDATGPRWLVLGGAAGVALGSLLPWAEVTAPALLVAAVAAIDMVDVSDRIGDVEGGDVAIQASIGIGLWIVLLGALAAVVGAVLALLSRRGA